MQARTDRISARAQGKTWHLLAVVGAAWAALTPGAAAAANLPAGIYTCTTADGRKLTSDRFIADCANREQRVLNHDGSLKTVVAPLVSPEERAAQEAQEYKRNAERIALAEAARRDRNLMMRYPNEAAHAKVRDAALDDVNKAMRTSEARLKELAKDRQPLIAETEFYKGKPLPGKLKQQLDANDAAADAQRSLIENQKAELVRVTALYDIELARLKQLWAGAAPGSLGPLPKK